MKLTEQQLQSGSVRRARSAIESAFLGQSITFLKTDKAKALARTLSYLYGSKHGDVEGLSVVFTSDSDRLIYWIGPTSALPSNAQTSRTITA